MLSPIRWLISNFSSLLLAFALAVVVWVSAVTAANPDVERSRTVPLEIIGLDPDMLIVANVPSQVRVTLRAPKTVSDSMAGSENAVQAWVDVSGLEAGTHTLEVQTRVSGNFKPVRLVQIDPQVITITLEPLVTRTMSVNLAVNGEPAIGYEKGMPGRNPATVTVSGRASLVSEVKSVQATLNIADATQSIKTDVPVIALDENGKPVEGVNITPDKITVTQPISLQGGFRNVVVRPVITGQPANGYRYTNISVTPFNVLVFSANPQVLNELPGYVETQPVDLTGAEDDVETFVPLNLPKGVSVAKTEDQRVLVQVSIAAIEGSLNITLPVTPIGLPPTLSAEISPDTVDLILSGPVPVLNRLKSTDVRVVVDLNGMDIGTYQVTPNVDVLPNRVKSQSILPPTVEVTIAEAATPTPAVTGAPGASGVP